MPSRTQAPHDQKVLLLARVAAQAANDTASVNDAELVASIIRELQPPHVRALTILAGHKLQHPDAAGVEGMTGLRTQGPGKATGSSQILRALMGLADEVADSVSATLERQGLIWNDPPGFGAWGITGYGSRILSLLRNTKSHP